MKNLIFIILSIFSFSLFANNDGCEGRYEAQIIAKVSKLETDSMTFCNAFVKMEDIKFFQEHQLCPLSKSTVVDTGIELELIHGHDCPVFIGDSISGVLILEDGFIRIE